jgi:hypothetical protein
MPIIEGKSGYAAKLWHLSRQVLLSQSQRLPLGAGADYGGITQESFQDGGRKHLGAVAVALILEAYAPIAATKMT